MQAESQPDYRLLYSLRGFQYCDLLLAPAERAAWQLTLECGNSFPLCLPSSRVTSDGFSSAISKPRGKESGDESPHSKTIRAVSQRATQTLKWMTDGKLGLLDIALDHLTLGRAALYESLLSDSPISNLKSEIEQSVSGLRRAGQLDDFPRGLLTRAWFRFLSGERTGPDSAQSDLDEAWEIAVRGPMRQHMADVLLSRARLFGMRNDEIPNDEGMTNTEGRMKQYPWDSPAADLAAAEKLINDCGYHRRDEELADAKAAMFRR